MSLKNTKLSQALGLDLELNYVSRGQVFTFLSTLPPKVSTLSQVWLPIVVTRWFPVTDSAMWGYHLYLMGERTFLDQYSWFHVYWMLLRPMATPKQQCSQGNRMCWWVEVNTAYIGRTNNWTQILVLCGYKIPNTIRYNPCYFKKTNKKNLFILLRILAPSHFSCTWMNHFWHLYTFHGFHLLYI